MKPPKRFNLDSPLKFLWGGRGGGQLEASNSQDFIFQGFNLKIFIGLALRLGIGIIGISFLF